MTRLMLCSPRCSCRPPRSLLRSGDGITTITGHVVKPAKLAPDDNRIELEALPGLPRLPELEGALQGRNSRGTIGWLSPFKRH